MRMERVVLCVRASQRENKEEEEREVCERDNLVRELLIMIAEARQSIHSWESGFSERYSSVKVLFVLRDSESERIPEREKAFRERRREERERLCVRA